MMTTTHALGRTLRQVGEDLSFGISQLGPQMLGLLLCLCLHEHKLA